MSAEIEKQVCSFELAKRLKELKVKQESLCHWLNIQHCIHFKEEDGYTVQDENGNPIIDKIDYRIELGNRFTYNIDKDNSWSAFTVAELGEMMPKELTSTSYGRNVGFYYTQIPDAGCTKWIIFYRNSMSTLKGCEVEDENEANARAKMLIYLLENKLLE